MTNKIKRKFLPGSEWLYIKIYTGYKTSDNLLSKQLFALVNSWLKKRLIKKFFFIRFSDPFYHIRFRIHLSDISKIGLIISEFNKAVDSKLQKNLITKIQYDTYNREIERYHHLLIEETENLFGIDSTCVIRIIKNIIQNEYEDNRWLAAIYLITSFLDCAEISIEVKLRLMQKLAENFKNEFGFNQFNSKQLNIKYREHKKIIEEVINHKYSQNGFETIYKSIDKRSNEIKPVIETIKRISIENNLDYLEYFESYIHMTINRIFPAKNRLLELLLYDLLSRYYKSTTVREKIDIQYV